MWRANSLEKDSEPGKDWEQEEKETTEDEMVGWRQSNEHEFEQVPGDSEGQGGLMCCRPWDHKDWIATSWNKCTTLLLPPAKNIHHRPPSNNIRLQSMKMNIVFHVLGGNICLSHEHSALQSAFLGPQPSCLLREDDICPLRCTQAAPSHEPSSNPQGCYDSDAPGGTWGSVSLLSSQPRTGLLLRGPSISAAESCEHMSSTNPSSAKEHELLTVS